MTKLRDFPHWNVREKSSLQFGTFHSFHSFGSPKMRERGQKFKGCRFKNMLVLVKWLAVVCFLLLPPCCCNGAKLRVQLAANPATTASNPLPLCLLPFSTFLPLRQSPRFNPPPKRSNCSSWPWPSFLAQPIQMCCVRPKLFLPNDELAFMPSQSFPFANSLPIKCLPQLQSKSPEMEEELKCPHCRHFLRHPLLLPCRHSYCRECALQAQKRCLPAVPVAAHCPLVGGTSPAASSSSAPSSSGFAMVNEEGNSAHCQALPTHYR